MAGGPIVVGAGKLKVNGKQIPVADEIRVMPSDEKREADVGIDGSIAMKVSYQSPYVEAALRHDPKVDWLKLFKETGATVLVEFNNGASYTLSESFYSGDSEIDAKDGKVQGRWNGTSCQQLT
jgi:hypothetical protein